MKVSHSIHCSIISFESLIENAPLQRKSEKDAEFGSQSVPRSSSKLKVKRLCHNLSHAYYQNYVSFCYKLLRKTNIQTWFRPFKEIMTQWDKLMLHALKNDQISIFLQIINFKILQKIGLGPNWNGWPVVFW